MWKLREVHLTGRQRRELEELRDRSPRIDVRERASAVLKVADGQAPFAVAQRGLLKPRKPDTVYAWLDRYAAEGIDGLLNHRQGGNQRRPFRRTGGLLGATATRPR